MKLLELKELVDHWVATGDWDEAELVLYDDRGNDLNSGIELTLECCSEDFEGRDKLIITEG